jgi:hypothetical protein
MIRRNGFPLLERASQGHPVGEVSRIQQKVILFYLARERIESWRRGRTKSHRRSAGRDDSFDAGVKLVPDACSSWVTRADNETVLSKVPIDEIDQLLRGKRLGQQQLFSGNFRCPLSILQK